MKEANGGSGVRTENRLAGERAAYLVQHAHDPVDWHTWSAETLAEAERTGKPVFLSVGYASCHWCHVMQRESFRDEETATYLNEHFVPVKVDREERPDLDHLYLQYVTMAAGSGGWPMNVFTDAEGRPFYGGTYFPKKPTFGMQSFAAVLTGVDAAWRESRVSVEETASEAVEVLADLQRPNRRALVPDLIDEAAEQLLALEDPERGGLGSAPKYPNWPVLRFLMERGKSDARAREAWRRWLQGMLRGGVYDQVGGGIFRYSTDAAWTVPHFEKMLYDNAQLLSALASAHLLEPTDEYEREMRRTARWMVRELAGPGGGFWSSLDAESGGIEGGAYWWTLSELREVLSAEEIALAARRLAVDAEASPTRTQIITRREGRAEEAEAVDAVLEKLARIRAQREHPRAIQNAPVEWNALAALGLLEAGEALGDGELVGAGRAVLETIYAEADALGELPHMLGAGGAARPALGLLADYAAVTRASAAAGDDFRQRAEGVLGKALDLFEDDGVLHMTQGGVDLPVRPVAFDDQPAPSGMALLLEAHRLLRPEDAEQFRRLLEPALGFAAHAPHLAGATLVLASKALEDA